MTSLLLADKEEGSAIQGSDKGPEQIGLEKSRGPLSFCFLFDGSSVTWTGKMNQRLDQFLHYLIVEKGLSKNTIEAYGHNLNRFLTHLQKKESKSLKKSANSM